MRVRMRCKIKPYNCYDAARKRENGDRNSGSPFLCKMNMIGNGGAPMGNKWKNLRSYWNKPQRAAYLFLLTAAILILVFNIIPLFASFFISMLDMGISFNSAKFIGLDNFKEALTDRRFINSLIVTIKFTVIEVPIQMVLGLVLSAMLTKNTFTNKLFRSIYFIPIVCSATAIGIMWQIILHSNVGLITYWVKLLGFGKVNLLNTSGADAGRCNFRIPLENLRYIHHYPYFGHAEFAR